MAYRPPAGAPGGDLRRPHRRLGDGEAAVAVEDRRHVGPRRDVGAVDQEQPDARAVERRVADVADRERRHRAAGNGRRPAGRPVRRARRATAMSGRRTSRRRRTPGRSRGRRRGRSRRSPGRGRRPCRASGRPRRSDALRRRPGSWPPRAAHRRPPAEPESTASPSGTSVSHARRVRRTGPAPHDPAARRASSRRRANHRRRRTPAGSSPRPLRSTVAHVAGRTGRAGGRRRGTSRPARGPAATRRPATSSRPATPADRGARPTRPDRPASDHRGGGGAPCGGTGRPPGSGCRRNPSRRAPRRRCMPGCWGSSRRDRGRRWSPARAARIARCHPRSSRRRSARRPARRGTSRWRWPRRRCRRPDRRGAAGRRPDRRPSAASARTARRRTGVRGRRGARRGPAPPSRRAGASTRRDARATTPVRDGHRAPGGCGRSAQPPTAGTSGESPTSSQRYGSGTSTPWRTSTTPSRLVGGGAVIGGGDGRQPRPMLGRLPWLALDRRSRALRFLVFFDIRRRVYGCAGRLPRAADETAVVTTGERPRSPRPAAGRRGRPSG